MRLENRFTVTTLIGPVLVVALTVGLVVFLKRRPHKVEVAPHANAPLSNPFQKPESRTIHGTYGDFVFNEPPTNATEAERARFLEAEKARFEKFNAKESERTIEEGAVAMTKADPIVQRAARFASKEEAEAVYQQRLAHYRKLNKALSDFTDRCIRIGKEKGASLEVSQRVEARIIDRIGVAAAVQVGDQVIENFTDQEKNLDTFMKNK